MKCHVEKETEKFLFDEIYTEGDDLLMEWPCQDATSGKESNEVDDDEQLSVNGSLHASCSHNRIFTMTTVFHRLRIFIRLLYRYWLLV